MSPTLLLACALLLPLTLLAKPAPLEQSVVKLHNHAQDWDVYSPWNTNDVEHFTGSGFVLEGGRILTNAHVVSWAKRLELERRLDPRRWAATVEFVSHEADLAVVKPEDPAFLEGLKPLPLGDLPALHSVVTTYGYPAGGQSLSMTKGVVSRIEYNLYVHPGSMYLLSVQTDAAINPGNSGGPVVQDGKVVGVAFQGIGSLENVGFFIPIPVVRHVLEDIADGRYDGFPDLGLRYSELQSKAYREFLALPPSVGGVIVDQILPNSPESKLFRPGDVLVSLGGKAIGNDGKILYRGHRLPFTLVLDEAQLGKELPCEVWREGKLQRFTLTTYRDLDRYRKYSNLYDLQPRYLVYAGLVFMPLQREFLQLFGPHWYVGAEDELLHHFFTLPLLEPEAELREPVVLTRVLPDRVNARLSYTSNMIVDKVNGRRIDGLAELAAALEQQVPRHVLEYSIPGSIDVLDAEEARRRHPEILTLYGLSKDRNL